MFQIWLTAVVFGMPVALQITSSQVEANSYERRFTISTVEKNFNDSLSWCRMDNNNNNNNSSLAVVNDSDTQMALALFLNSSSHSSTAPMFINLRLSQQVPSTWYLVNRTHYEGYIENQNTHNYFLNGHLKFQGDYNFFGVDGSSPADFRNYICDFEENKCSTGPTGNIVYNGRCYVKYENENLTWYKARERCIGNGGDLAQFQNYNDAWFPPFNTTWLDKSLTYWIGIRWNGWSWNSSGSDYESIFTSWSINKPNNINYECVCVDPNGSPLWSWTDCDCNVQRQFVCLKEVTIQTTTPMTTTAITTTMNPTTLADLVTTIGFSVTTSNNNNTTTTKDVDHTNLIIGVVVGVGGGLILLIVVIVVVVIICKRRQRRSKSGSDTGSDGNENGGYNENVQNGVYAAVVPGKNQGKQTESMSETIYTSPLFTKETNSPPPDPNYEAVDLVEEPDVVRSLNTSRGRQTKSIFPQGDTDGYANAKEVPNATD